MKQKADNWIDTKQREIQDVSRNKKELESQLSLINDLYEKVNTYYRAYYEDASFEVQICNVTEKKVDMSVYKGQLGNMDRRAAADVIIKEAKANFIYLEKQKTIITNQLNQIDSSSGKERGFSIDTMNSQIRSEALSQFKNDYMQILASDNMVSLERQSLGIHKFFGKIDWNTAEYVIPKSTTPTLLLGYMDLPTEIPVEYSDLLSDKLLFNGKTFMHVPMGIDVGKPFKLLVNYHISQANETKEGIRTLLGNMIRFTAPKEIKVYYMDLETYGAGNLSALVKLSSKKGGFLHSIADNSEEVYNQLLSIYNQSNEIIKKITGYKDVCDYNDHSNSKNKIQRKVIILNGCPEKLEHKSLELFQKLYYMAEQCGISIVAIHDINASMGNSEAQLFYKNMREHGYVVQANSEMQFIGNENDFARFSWNTGLNMLSESFISKVNDAYKEIEVQVKPADENIFNEIQHIRGNKNLNLTYGVNENNNLEKLLVCNNNGHIDDMGFATYISGSAGSGKSTLLHTIIANILLTMHPEDVELWLMDFKMTEFQLYADHMPPHVKRIVLESSEDVVYSVIDELTDILEKRESIYSNNGIKNVLDLPDKFHYVHAPLIFVIIDEFSVMSQIIKDAPEKNGVSYKFKLEKLLRKGRSNGFRFIFSDQTYSVGSSGLSEPAKFQIGYRLALANNSAQEMRETLNWQQLDKTETLVDWANSLPPHYVLSSRKMPVQGSEDSFRYEVHRSKVSYIPSNRIIEIIDRLNLQYKSVDKPNEVNDNTYLNKKPLVADGKIRTSFKQELSKIIEHDNILYCSYGEKIIYPGKPCALQPINSIYLNRTPGQNMLMFIQHDEMMVSEIRSIVASAMTNGLKAKSKITILMHPSGEIYNKYKELWSKLNCITDLVEICKKIHSLHESVNNNMDQNETIIILGLYNLYQEWNLLKGNNIKTSANSGLSFVQPKMPSFTNENKPITNLFNNLDNDEEDDSDDLMATIAKLKAGSENRVASENIAQTVSSNKIYRDKKEVEVAYDATEDFEFLLKRGPSKGVHFVLCMKQFSEFKELKIKGTNFQHLLYEWLAREDISDILGIGHAAKIPEGALRYASKQNAFSFRSFLWKNLVIDDMTLDDNGNITRVTKEIEFI